MVLTRQVYCTQSVPIVHLRAGRPHHTLPALFLEFLGAEGSAVVDRTTVLEFAPYEDLYRRNCRLRGETTRA